jgi:opacity protein-like surface antigen
MRSFFVLVAILIAVGPHSTALADDVRGYATASIGAAMPTTIDYELRDHFVSATADMDAGYVVGAGLGVDLGILRPEFRVDYHKSSLGQAHLNPFVPANVPPTGLPVLTMIGELNLDFPILDDWLEAHGGLGVGAAQLRTDVAPDWDLAWTASGGFYIPRLDPFGIDIMYRYTGLSEGFVRKDRGPYEVTRWHAHEITFALRFMFGAKPKPDLDE